MSLEFEQGDDVLNESTECLVEERMHRKCSHWVAFIVLYITLGIGIFSVIRYNYHSKDPNNWNYMLFTQQYPPTACFATNHHNASVCKSDLWRIHGIWPTEGSKMSPFHCHNIPFNVTLLEPILHDLDKWWPSYEKDYAFWEHEWTKHGTCAIDDPFLDSEFKYFKQGLIWNAQWNLTSILEENAIVPSNIYRYSLKDFNDVFQQKIGYSVDLACYYSKESRKYYIQEIRLCINKTLHLINCNYHPDKDTNCPTEDIHYPTSIDYVF